MNNIINSYLPNCLHRKNNHNQLINTLKECLENIQSQKKKKVQTLEKLPSPVHSFSLCAMTSPKLTQ